MEELEIRDCTENDFDAIRNILQKSWAKAYDFIPERDRTKYLETVYSDSELKKMLGSPFDSLFLAVVKGYAVGYLRLKEVPREKRIYLSSIYILPDNQGKGYGGKLMDFAFGESKKRGYREIWIGVMERNRGALNWYKRLGFEFVKEEPFEMGTTSVRHFIGYKKLDD